MLAYLAGRWKGHCIFCRAEPIPLLRALGSFLWYLWPSVLSRIRSTVVPTSPNCTSTGPCHRLGTLLAVESLVVYKSKASVACLPYCAPVVCRMWKTGLLCQGLSPWLTLSLDVAHWTCSQSYSIIQLAPETYPNVRFSAFAPNQHEGLKAMVKASWKFLVSCSPLGDLGRLSMEPETPGSSTGASQAMLRFTGQPALSPPCVYLESPDRGTVMVPVGPSHEGSRCFRASCSSCRPHGLSIRIWLSQKRFVGHMLALEKDCRLN